MGDPNVVQGGWVFMIKDGGRSAEVIPRFMTLAYQTLSLFKRNPQTSPSEEPAFCGVLKKGTVVEELGRRVLPNGQVLHLFSFCDPSSASKKVEIGCSAAEAAHEWVNALEFATNLPTVPGAGPNGKDVGHRTMKQSVAKFIPIGGAQVHPLGASRGEGEEDDDDADAVGWKLIRLINGLRIFEGYPLHGEDWSPGQRLLKGEGVVEAEPDRIFEVIMNASDASRSQWDPVTDTMEVIEILDGFTDTIKAAFSVPGKGGKHTPREMVAKRSWRRNADRSYVISFWPDEHSTKQISSDKSGRLDSAVYTWDIVPLCGHSSTGSMRGVGVPTSPYARSLVRYVLEVQHKTSHSKFKLPFFRSHAKKEERERASSLGSIAGSPAGASSRDRERERERERDHDSLAEPGALEEFADGVALASLSRIAGLREYFACLPPPSAGSGVYGQSMDATTFSGMLSGSSKMGVVLGEEFFDALELSVTSDVDEQRKACARKRWARIKWLVRFGLLIQSLSDNTEATGLSWNIPRELLHNCPPVDLPALGKKLSALANVPKCEKAEAVQSAQHSCRDPGGGDFTVRGPNYLSDRVKVAAGDPLLQLVGMDWFTDNARMDNIAARPGCLVQSEAGKAIPFFFVVNLQVPGPPHYSLVAYLASDRPVRAHPRSLLHRFCNSDDEFRNARFKLIPRISEGHWMVKRAVGTKAAILGRALKCQYHKGANYLEMDCDIGSSSVARNVIGLVISYVTSLVVDLVFLIEAQEAEDLPEYLLGALTCIKLDTKKATAPPPVGSSEPEGGA